MSIIINREVEKIKQKIFILQTLRELMGGFLYAPSDILRSQSVPWIEEIDHEIFQYNQWLDRQEKR